MVLQKAVSDRKDRLIQTRVPRQLASDLKREADRQGRTVSGLVREILEEALDLVDDVVSDVDRIVDDAVALGRNVARGARRVADTARRETGGEGDRLDLDEVDAWNEVVVNRDQTCSRCAAPLARGGTAHTGVSGRSATARAWLCDPCMAEIAPR